MVCLLCSSYMFRPLDGHHQGGTYKGIQLQQILSKMCMCRVIKSWKYALINRHFLKFWTVFYLPLPKTCVDFCHLHTKGISLCCLTGVYAMVALSFWSRVVKRESFSFCLFIDGLFNGPAVTRTVCCLMAGRVMNIKGWGRKRPWRNFGRCLGICLQRLRTVMKKKLQPR